VTKTAATPAFEHSGDAASGGLSLEGAERMLAQSVERCRRIYGRRLVAAYALGSLARGGFRPHVSDVDLGLVLADPLDADAKKGVDQVLREARASGEPLAERLSIFWGSPRTLYEAAQGGRFSPPDVLDLARYGRLLAGEDVRAHVRLPTPNELLVSSATFAHDRLSTRQTDAYLRDPASLAAAGVRALTKLALFPVRFLFSARTGDVGANDRSVEHFQAVNSGPAAELAAKALGWRSVPPRADDGSVIEALRQGMLPLYRLFVEEYGERLRACGAVELADAYNEWQARLKTGV
jgi:hypothetical protein